MGIDYLNWKKQKRDGAIAMDEQLRHPDGSICHAKSEESCPILNKAKKASEADALEAKADSEAMEAIKEGDDPEREGIVPVAIEDLATFAEGSTNSKYRKARNEAFKKIKELNLGDGSYELGDPPKKVTHKGNDGKEHDGFADGFQVSFQTTNGEGFDRESKDLLMSDEDYDKNVEALSAETGSKPYVGVFGGIPEISFRCDTYKQAMAIARRFNQVSIANNFRITIDKFNRLTFPKNKKYNWRENQTFKAEK